MKPDLIGMGLIPLDKSWIIRMGFLDLVNNYDDTIKFLRERDSLSDDLKALLKSSIDWISGSTTIDVGESGTLYRFLKFASWKLGLKKSFITHGTLSSRKISDDPEIVNYNLEELMKLDGGTSQWASASVLMGNVETPENLPYKLDLTYKALAHWKEKRSDGSMWEPRYDRTILNQALSFIQIMETGSTDFVPKHSEDYCFSRAFGLITKEKGEETWPSLRGHESNRIESMEESISLLNSSGEITSKDHRVIQSLCMLAMKKRIKVKISHPDSVNKSWPQFWDFVKFVGSGENY